jgi:3-oxoacyl-[acyl-carrier protein] reductase
MTRELEGRIALITGAASGIGAATAIELARAGARVVLADISAPERTTTTIVGEGNAAVSVVCDVANEASVNRLFATIAEQHGGLDIAVNCAGILRQGRLIDAPIADFDRTVAVNLRGTYLVGRGAITLMRATGRPAPQTGRMINIASELAYLGRADFSAYCATKAAVLGLTRSWAREFAPDILVNSVAPGPIDTPMLGLEAMTAEWREKENDVPLGRVGTPAEIAGTVRYLAGPAASYMTGQTISPNGGAVMF